MNIILGVFTAIMFAANLIRALDARVPEKTVTEPVCPPPARPSGRYGTVQPGMYRDARIRQAIRNARSNEYL